MTDQIQFEQKVKGWRRFVLISPPTLLLIFAIAATGTIYTDLIINHTCRITLNINETECLLLRTNSASTEALKLEAEIEPYVSPIIMAKSIIDSLVPALLILFMGPWSNKHGRRPPLLAGSTGFMISFSLLTIICEWNINPWFLLLTSIPSTVLGGFCYVTLASYCHVTDITRDDARTMLLAWLQAILLIGLVGGIFCGPLIYRASGYRAVFAAAAVASLTATLWTFFCIPETINQCCTESMWSFFKWSSVKDLFTSSLTKQNLYNRVLIWIAIFSLSIGVFATHGELTIVFLFTRKRLGWDVQTFSYYNGSSPILGIIGVLFGIKVLGSCLGVSDLLLLVLACASSIGAAVVKSLTFQPWHMYLSSVIGMFSGLCGPVIRSVLSKSVSSDDIAHIFSLVSAMETITTFGSAPLYTMIYSHYLPPVYPSPVWLISAGFYSLLLVFAFGMEVMKLKARNTLTHVPLIEEDQ